ncbi:MAG: bifunctional [glutamine synthetase] adenylyltransferase/[glutamine synthetase]-adenylyl-L-tyrosine phosphorylase, partial [Mycobacterium sp.]|nr:bifunctional [glutamine synthetase] adenylyltransferase/[glutamine synthetase]-adenylyl-L-tyrosine phosphorylase [Mycobacterium sp.]
MVVSRPVTQRPKVPSVGRLGLVDARASENLAQLGWTSESHVELLWSLSRAPDADAALLAIVRLAEALGDDWNELDAALLTDRGLRGRLFAVFGSSLALGDHLIANPQSWRLLRGAGGNVKLPSAEQLREAFTNCVAETSAGPSSVALRLRILYRNRVLVLAALDLAPTVENEPVLPFSAVGAHLADIADAALAAALTVAEAAVCGHDTPPRLAVIAMGKCGARELNYVSDVDVIFVAE